MSEMETAFVFPTGNIHFYRITYRVIIDLYPDTCGGSFANLWADDHSYTSIKKIL